MNLFERQANIGGWIGVTCIVFMWQLMLFPNSVTVIMPVFENIGPFSWLLPLAMILLPIMAAKRGSKWWWLVTTAGVLTLGAALRIAAAWISIIEKS
jgi:hypothetical protein